MSFTKNPCAICVLKLLILLLLCLLSFYTSYIRGCPTASPNIVANKDDADLKVLVPNITSLRQFVDCSDPRRVHGFCIDVFERALSILKPMSIHYSCFNFSSDVTQSGPTYNDMIEFVANGTYDAVVGDVTIGAQRLSMVDFTHYYMESGVVVLTNVAPQGSSSPWFFFGWPFSIRMWCTIVGAFAFIGALICFLEHNNHPEFKQGHISHRIENILWFIIEALVLLERESVRSSVSRLMMVAWVFFVILVGASYTAGLSSFFTANSLSQSTHDIISLKESGKPIGFRKGSIVKDYLTRRFHIREEQLIPIRLVSDYINNLTKGPNGKGVVAIVDELPYVNMILANLSSSTCDFNISGPQLTREGFGFGFNKGRNLADEFSGAVLNLSESGCLQELQGIAKMDGSSKCSIVNSYSSQVSWKSSLALFFPFVGALSIVIFVNCVKGYTCSRRPRLGEMSHVMDDPTMYMYPEMNYRNPHREIESYN